jgi:class 3 adenylate cyclase
VADLALVGDSINLAFRLSSLGSRALPEPILVCEKTAPLVEKHFKLIDLGPMEIKGRVEPAPVFALKPSTQKPEIPGSS